VQVGTNVQAKFKVVSRSDQDEIQTGQIDPVQGDMVAVLAVPGCGASDCPECSRGYPQICMLGEHYGIGDDGSYAPYVAIKARAAVPLPKGS